MKRLAMGSIASALLAIATTSARGSESGRDNQQTVNPAFLKPAATRTFEIEYTAKITEIPAGTKQLRVWVPVPQDSTVQTIRDLSFSRAPRFTTEPKYGNRIAYWEIESPTGSSLDLTMKFVCARQDVRVDLEKLGNDSAEPAKLFSVFKEPDTLVTVDDDIRKLANEVAGERQTTLAKARAIYDYVVAQMTYDKNHAGWGLGSTRHACEVGKGNCTDFHALFNSLCRAQGIASGFEIGLYLPYDRNSPEKLGGYHCWAFFRVPGKTWVPVDCSEADRFPDRKEFFFGGHTSNRVTLSTGRDLVLEPKQEGEPLNYFLNPHAEADGAVVKTDKSWAYRDLN